MQLDTALLTTGLSYELCTHNVRKYTNAFLGGFNAVLEQYDADNPSVAPCTGDILCAREGVRHKAGCIGRVAPFEQYARELS